MCLKVIVKRGRFTTKAPNRSGQISLSFLFPVTVIAFRFWRATFLTVFSSGQPALRSGYRCLGGPWRGERERFVLIALARLIS